MQKRMVNLLLIIWLLGSCSQWREKTAKTPAPYREKILKLIEKTKFSHPMELAQGGEYRLAITPGQWVSFVTTAKDGSDTLVLTTIKILAVKGSEVTIETESYSSLNGSKTVFQKVVANFPAKNDVLFTNVKFDEELLKMKVVRANFQVDDGPVQELEVQDFDNAGFSKALFSHLGLLGNVAEVGPCQTPYLVSNFCQKFNYTMQMYDKTTQGTTWGHSLVPIVGHLKIENDQQKTEVIAFGLTGATSALH